MIKTLLGFKGGSERRVFGAGDSAQTELQTDTSRPIRVGFWVLGVGLGGFLLWAGLAPLDEGVPAQGSVVIDTRSKPVQHELGGVVREVLAGEGMPVKAGDVLLRLNDAGARSTYESIRQHYFGLRAMESRLLAEQTGASGITFHPDLLKEANDPLVAQHISGQRLLLQTRRAEMAADVAGMEEAIQGNEAQLVGLSAQLDSRKEQLALFREELKGAQDLVREGYLPRIKQIELERNVSELMAIIADLQANLIRTRRTIAELRTRIVSRKQAYRKEVDTALAEVRRDVDAESDRYRKAAEDLARTEIRSPATGQVVGLVVQSVGSVIQPGQKLMDIVPGDEKLLLEAKVAPQYIDKIHAGLTTDVRFSTFSNSPLLVVEGKVASISGEPVQDQRDNQQYFLARVEVTADGKKQLGQRRLQPGMPADVVIKTGERTVLTYLLHPLMKRLGASMKEE